MASLLNFAKLSAAIQSSGVQPYQPQRPSPGSFLGVSDSHYDQEIPHTGTEPRARGVAVGTPLLHALVVDGSLARIRLKTSLAAAPAGDLPMPTISPTSSRDDLSVLGARRLTALARHRSFWLALYFALNLTLTLYNKAVLVSFPFPYTLTAIHSLCAALGGRLLLARGVYRPKPLSLPDHAVLALFSVLYSINIAVSNASLELVTIPLHQVIRGTTPLFTTLLAAYLLDARITPYKLLALAPVVFGVGLATFGDYYATPWGCLLTLLGAVLAALKTVSTNLLQTSTRCPPSSSSSSQLSPPPIRARLFGLTLTIPRPPALRRPRLALHPLDLLTRTSPYALAQCLFYAHASGELDALRSGTAFRHAGALPALVLPAALAVNGTVAFGLNVVSFETNRRAGAVAMGVASNVKQVLTILCAVSLFQLSISRTNAIGIVLTLVGGAWYAAVECAERRRR